MKVVLFCGGMGLRLRDYSEKIPKPMVPIGYRPILWHLMKYYAHFGHTDFILCLGYKADMIKEYFLNYNECVSNDFVMDGGQVHLLGRDTDEWRITFVDTGLEANIGQRLMAVREHLRDDEMFLANYSDNVSDVSMPKVIEHVKSADKAACFVSVCPSQSFHLVDVGDDSSVTDIYPVSKADLWMNGGFFVFRRDIFDYIREGEELVLEPFRRLIAARQLCSYRHEGFWACMDTFKEWQTLEDLAAKGAAPWEIWKARQDTTPQGAKARPTPQRIPPRTFDQAPPAEGAPRGHAAKPEKVYTGLPGVER